jgi:hypothetical protein
MNADSRAADTTRLIATTSDRTTCGDARRDLSAREASHDRAGNYDQRRVAIEDRPR